MQGMSITGFNEKEVPQIVPIVLSQMAKMRSSGMMDEYTFRTNLERLSREELRPRGLIVVMRKLPDGKSRFVIRPKGKMEACGSIEC